MMPNLASANGTHVPLIGWAVLLAIALASGSSLSAAEDTLHHASSACRNDATVTGEQFEPIRHNVSTATLLGTERTEVRWILSSEVIALPAPPTEGPRFCYAYVFENAGSTPVNISLVSPEVALSPLFDIMQDFSLELDPGATEVIRFSTAVPPELSLATAYNSALDNKVHQWDFVSSRPITLYLPASFKPPYILPASVVPSLERPHLPE